MLLDKQMKEKYGEKRSYAERAKKMMHIVPYNFYDNRNIFQFVRVVRFCALESMGVRLFICRHEPWRKWNNNNEKWRERASERDVQM